MMPPPRGQRHRPTKSASPASGRRMRVRGEMKLWSFTGDPAAVTDYGALETERRRAHVRDRDNAPGERPFCRAHCRRR